ncbi:KAD9 kinase, partial [Origma solitaria]|nr:KAD9 kinase [Origma solitaria]
EKFRRRAVEKAIAAVKNRLELEEETEESGIPEITADHPDVQAMVEEAMKSASQVPLPQIHAEILEEAIAELMKTNKDRFPGASEKGGWVVDNYPLSVDHWSALSEKGLLPDTVVCLKGTEKDGYLSFPRNLLRECGGRKPLRIVSMVTMLRKSKEDAEQKIMRDWHIGIACESPRFRARKDSAMQAESAGSSFPDTQEIETIKKNFMNDWQAVESEIKISSQVQVVVLEIAEQTPESLLNQTVLVMEKPFKYHGWKLSDVDLEEEAQDLAAEEENEEDEEEEE